MVFPYTDSSKVTNTLRFQHPNSTNPLSHFFSIIPFDHSIGITPLVYEAGDISELSIGTIVTIPYGSRIEHGLITGIYSESPIDRASEEFARIKSVIDVVTKTPLLASYQIMMILALARRYMIPIHRVLGIWLTRPILSRLEKKQYSQLGEIPTFQHSSIPTFTNILSLLQDRIVTPELVESAISDKTVIILPDGYAMMPYRERYRDRDDILFVHDDMTDVRRAQAWIDISNGLFPIIYGTRRILLYNLEQYDHVIYIEDALGPDYWHYPIHIDYLDILRMLVDSHPPFRVSILTSTPRLTTLSLFRDFELKNIEPIEPNT